MTPEDIITISFSKDGVTLIQDVTWGPLGVGSADKFLKYGEIEDKLLAFQLLKVKPVILGNVLTHLKLTCKILPDEPNARAPEKPKPNIKLSTKPKQKRDSVVSQKVLRRLVAKGVIMHVGKVPFLRSPSKYTNILYDSTRQAFLYESASRHKMIVILFGTLFRSWKTLNLHVLTGKDWQAYTTCQNQYIGLMKAGDCTFSLLIPILRFLGVIQTELRHHPNTDHVERRRHPYTAVRWNGKDVHKAVRDFCSEHADDRNIPGKDSTK